MKIVFISEMFPPFAPGGAEWSIFYLAEDLIKIGNQVTVVTPNYGAPAFEIMGGVKIRRFPFYQKLTKNIFPGNFSFTNPLWVFWSTVMYFWFLRSESADLIHVHGKYSIPSVRIANLIIKKPIIVTIRDYQVICNYGACLMHSDKSCSLKEYFLSDFIKYCQDYLTSKNVLAYFSNLLFAVWGRFSRNYLKLFAKDLHTICLSNKQAEIFRTNGFSKVSVIGNSFDFNLTKNPIKKENIVAFAGRLTPGKGMRLIADILPDFFARFPDFNIEIAGEGPIKEELKAAARNNKHLKILGQIHHDDTLKLFSRAKLVLVPSVWPEPFGRVAMETIALNTPVVVSNRGGLPEIVKDGKWGFIVEPTSKSLFEGIEKALTLNLNLINNIKRDFMTIKTRFGGSVAESYLELYKRELSK